MSLRLAPNVLRLVTGFLRAQTEVSALVDDRVYSDIPKDPTWPLVRVSHLGGGTRTDPAYHLFAELVQVDCWGGPRIATFNLAETCRAAMSQRLIGAHTVGADSAVVSGISPGGLREDSDDTYAPAKPRVRFDCVIYTHPG